MQVVHVAFTYLLLTLIYFHLECKKLVEIPDSLLDSALVPCGKEDDIEGKAISLSVYAIW